MNSKVTIKDNQKKVRLYDEETIHRVDVLLLKGYYSSFNELANAAMNIGVTDIYRRTFDAKAYADEHKKSSGADMDLALEKLNALLEGQDELSVNIQIVKTLCQIIYTIWKAQHEGKKIEMSEIENGLICEQPAFLSEIEIELNKEIKRRK